MKDRVIPQEGDVFNAYTNEYGNKVRGGPFVCCKRKRGGKWIAAVDEMNYVINAKDKNGGIRQFRWLNKNQSPKPVKRIQDWTFTFEILPRR